MNYLTVAIGEYPLLQWTELSRCVLKGEEKVEFKRTKIGDKPSFAILLDKKHYDSGLFSILRKLRMQCAEAESLPPYAVFGDRTLMEMAASYPTTEQ